MLKKKKESGRGAWGEEGGRCQRRGRGEGKKKKKKRRKKGKKLDGTEAVEKTAKRTEGG